MPTVLRPSDPARGESLRLITAFLFFLGLAFHAPAHDTWLIPAGVSGQRGQVAVLDLTSGMSFPVLEVAVQPDRIAVASLRLAGKTMEIRDRTPAKNSLRLSAAMPEEGIGTVWVETKPNDIELKAGQVEEYLKEIGAWDTVGREWRSGPSKRWREIYTKHAKTFLRLGRSRTDRSWAEPVGMLLEIVPEKDPTTLHVGDELPVRVLREGRPLPNFPVGLAAAGGRGGAVRNTDDRGRVIMQLNQAGWWLLKGAELRRSKRRDADWESDFTTMTLDVEPPPDSPK